MTAHTHARRRYRSLAWAAALTATTIAVVMATQSLADAAPANTAGSATRHVTYLGHTYAVPSSWAVVTLAKSPNACVRFDVHAIYLGTPSSTQKCSAKGVSAVEGAILVQPAGSSAAASATDSAIDQRITATLGSARITASYGADRSVVTKILASAGVPTPRMAAASTGVAPRAQLSPGVTSKTFSGVSAAQLTYNFVGEGFDACTAPSTAQMTAWGSSPYKAIGVYFGGTDRACAQPELTASWVSTEAAAGWHLLPLYAGAQVSPTNQLSSPASQGTAAANDAATQAQAIGLGQDALLYYDMEGGDYTAADSTAVEAFLSAWTARLHALGYYSGVYGQENGALDVLITDWGSMTEPDVIDVDNPNGLMNDDPGADPANHWSLHRVHQFVADSTQSYGGVSIEIDEDYFNVLSNCEPTSSAGGSMQARYVRNCGVLSVPLKP